MKSFFLAFVALTLVVDAAIALECYTCGYYEGMPTEGYENEDGWDKSCQSGKKPNKKLLTTCVSAATLCLKEVFEATVDGKNVKGTVRGCTNEAGLGGLEAEKCHDREGYFAGLPISVKAKVTTCSCKGDKCNSSSMLKVTQASFVVLALGFFASKFMY